MKKAKWTTNSMDDIGISTYLSTKQCDIRSRALRWVPIPMPMPTHAHGFWVGMNVILLFMGGHGCNIIGDIIGNVTNFEYMGAI